MSYTKRRTVIEVIDNLLTKRRKKDNDCWIYTGSITENTHGNIGFQGKAVKLHRFIAYVCLGFDLNSPLNILHSCDTPACFNPLHLTIGTQSQNMADAHKRNRIRSYRASLTHCPQGHEYSVENTYIDPINKSRRCIICKRRHCQESRKRKISK